jgi:hypothetical protein
MNCSTCNHKLVTFCPSCGAKKPSPKRAKASRENGKKGGRPKKLHVANLEIQVF